MLMYIVQKNYYLDEEVEFIGKLVQNDSARLLHLEELRNIGKLEHKKRIVK